MTAKVDKDSQYPYENQYELCDWIPTPKFWSPIVLSNQQQTPYDVINHNASDVGTPKSKQDSDHTLRIGNKIDHRGFRR